MSATVSEFKGHPIISLALNGDREFTFGLAKAKAILDNLEARRLGQRLLQRKEN